MLVVIEEGELPGATVLGVPAPNSISGVALGADSVALQSRHKPRDIILDRPSAAPLSGLGFIRLNYPARETCHFACLETRRPEPRA